MLFIFIFLNLFIIIYIVTYPLIEIIRGSMMPEKKSFVSSELEIPVSIIISVFNEERYIQAKIDELLAENIWLPGSELLIVAAGCTDNTAVIFNMYVDEPKIRIFIFDEHITKIESINLAVQSAKNDYWVFSDCRQTMKTGSIGVLVNTLIREKIGVAAATLVNLKNGKPNQSFRKWLNRMNVLKGRNGSSMNVYGALYALHKSTFRPIPTNILFDDLFVLASSLSQRKRVVQLDEAVIYEVNFETYYQDERIQRLTRGLLIFFVYHFQLIRKIKLNYLFHFILSKYAKLMLPVFVFSLISLLMIVTIQSERLLYWMGAFFVLVLSVCFYFAIPFFRLCLNLLYYTIKAEYLFFFKNKTSIKWEKLKH